MSSNKAAFRNYGAFLYGALFLSGLLWTLYLLLTSPGVPVQDEVGHYLLSRYAWQYPEHLLNLWGRPFRTLLYMLPALGDLTTARLASLLIACVTVLVTTEFAKHIGVKSLFLIPAFLWFQPWFHDLSYAVLPQVPFSLLLVLASYFWMTDKHIYASIVLGFLPLTRHEGVLLVGLWFLYRLCKCDWKSSLIAISPLLIFTIIYYIAVDEFALDIYFSAKPTTLYGSGDWLHFIRPLPSNVGGLVLLLTLIYVIPLAKSNKKAIFFAGYGIYFLIHTIIYRFGLYASGGYQIFLLPLAPLFAILSASGFEYLILTFTNTHFFSRLTHKIQVIILAFCMVSVICVVVWRGLQTPSRPLDSEGIILAQVYDWVSHSDLVYPKIVSTHVWYYYFQNLPAKSEELWYSPLQLDTLPVNTLVVWDRHYSDRWGVLYSVLSDPEGDFRVLRVFGDGFAIVFQKQEGVLP